MEFTMMILTPALTFSEALREVLLRALPGTRIQIAEDARAARKTIGSVHALLTTGSALDDELLRSATELRWIQSLGTGVDGIVDRHDLASNVVVTNAKGLFDEAVSECGLALMLALARDLPRAVKNQMAQRWEYWTPRLLSGKTVGIVGVGAIGGALARKCRALNMTVIGVSNRAKAPDIDLLQSYAQLAGVAAEVHYLVLTASLTHQTRGLIDQQIFAAMRSDACLINLGRGAMVVEEDLLAALSNRQIAGAALDAFIHEPLPRNQALWTAPNLLISPHLAGPNDTHVARVSAIITANARAFLEGRVPAGLINTVTRSA